MSTAEAVAVASSLGMQAAYFRSAQDALPLLPEYLLGVVRKDDPQFKALVDKTVGGVMKTGEINMIYAKWFTGPIPPKGINMNFPQTPAIKAAFANPNDKGV